jgi:2-hydroxychromene-2-carboxylate isomerase
LAHKQIRKIELENNIKVNYKPVLLGGLHKLAGITANAFIPAKAKFMIRDCKMCAEKLNIEFKFNSFFPISSLDLMRGVLIAEKNNKKKEYIDIFFDAYWKNDFNLNDKNLILKLLKKIALSKMEFEDEIKNELKNKTQEAFNRGIFGTPSFMVNNKMFFGQDRIEFVLKEAEK